MFDRDRLGAVASTSYGQGANSTEAGSVRMDLLYDPYSRLVSSKRCVVAVSVSRSDALNCLVDQQAYDQYGRPYWSSDASSENVLHSDNPYANAQGSYRGIRQHYSDEGTVVEGVAVNAGFAFKSTNLTGTQVYLETLSTNARGQVTAERVDGKTQFTTTRGYEASTGRLLTINTDSVQNLTVTYDELGNLRSRTDQSAGRQLVENFSLYDVQNRVLTAELKNAGLIQGNLTMSYSDDGNVLTKVGDGVYSQASIGGYSYGDSVALTQDCAAGSKHAVRARLATRGTATTPTAIKPDRCAEVILRRNG